MISVVKAGESDEAFFSGAAARLNVFCFFTIQSNLILALTCLLLAAGIASSATWFRVLRLIGVVGIALTFVVFQAVLRDLQDLTGLHALADFLLHTLSPILGVGGWLLFGPRRLTSVSVVWGPRRTWPPTGCSRSSAAPSSRTATARTSTRTGS